MNFYVITVCYVVVGGLGIGIFLWGKPSGNSCFDRLYRVVCIHFPRILKKLLEKCCGPRGPAALDWLWTYICYRTNPIVQLFYLMVVVGGYLTFCAHAFPHLPNKFVGTNHKYSGLAVFAGCLWVWWKACSTDPGTVTQENADDLCKIFEWDDQIFTSSECKTCELIKPARSKHCALCNVCVARFDHHCIWINNCVGLGNHKWFLLFLFMHLVLCLYGCGMGTTIVYDVILRKDLFSAVFVDPVTKQKHRASWLIICQYMLATEGMMIFVTILAAIMGLVLFGFFLWHLNLVRIGTTTNELSKWNWVKWCLKQEEDGKEKVKQLVNIYNKGCRKNFAEVAFPLDVHNLPSQLNGQIKKSEAVRSEEDNNPIKGEGSSKRKGKDKAKKS
eukprot:CAMPEP_0172743574 /NCGR_PEP_ID=MMETSP1074-20121228/132620_1 /TAXON_ID=2916 /ORGANISM="Ceratium fusus, Strain PA161109" /LENGTH=387 /DNA_ID=CAMNT_0013574321 /DNA_START=14 /DNA_END=1177 /DNA_ORIENTATION=+